MEIGLYEDWMKPQVSTLFSIQYGVKEEDFSRLIGNFYELPFQKNKCIRIVATEGDKVIGFQSFFYWPYTFNGKTFNAYQSGNSLVHPDYRGKGIFQSLLNYLEMQRTIFNIDFLTGFPIDASVGSLLRNKWQNVFNLQWYIKMLHPLSVLLPLNHKKLQALFPDRNLFTAGNANDAFIKVENSQAFADWRSTHYEQHYYSFYFTKDREEVVFKLKTNIRKKYIKELIIGDIITTSYDAGFMETAVAAFLKEAKKVKSISLVSIALNEKSKTNITAALLKTGFKKISKQIYFCVKPLSENPDNAVILVPDKWAVYRGDIDTW